MTTLRPIRSLLLLATGLVVAACVPGRRGSCSPAESQARRAAVSPRSEVDPARQAAFFDAARRGDVNALRDYVEAGFDINAAAARLVLDRRDGYSVETDGATALLLAANNAHFAAVDFLVCQGADLDVLTRRGDSALHRAVARGAVDIVRLLLDHGAQTNPDLPAFAGLTGTALHTAAGQGDEAIVRALLEAGADADAMVMGLTPLDMAANDRIARLLRASGSLPEKAERELQRMTLHDAAMNGSAWQLRRLLERGDDPNALDASGATPIFYAASGGHLDLVERLIEAGAQVDAGEDDETPLVRAVVGDRPDIVALLLAHGADPAATDFRGRPAIDIAKSEGVRAALRSALPPPAARPVAAGPRPLDAEERARLADINDTVLAVLRAKGELRRLEEQGMAGTEVAALRSRVAALDAELSSKMQASRPAAAGRHSMTSPASTDCAAYLEQVGGPGGGALESGYADWAEGFAGPLVDYDVCAGRSFDRADWLRFIDAHCSAHPETSIQASVREFICN